MGTAIIDESSTTTSKSSDQKAAGHQRPIFLGGHPRAFWAELLESRRSAAVAAPLVQFENFDLNEIMDELHYGTDCKWAA